MARLASNVATEGQFVVVSVPTMGDSIPEGTIKNWGKKVGDHVNENDDVAFIETDKVVIEIRAPKSGVIVECFANQGDTVKVGAKLFKLDTSKTAPAKAAETPKPQPQAAQPQAARPQAAQPQAAQPQAAQPQAAQPQAAAPPPPSQQPAAKVSPVQSAPPSTPSSGPAGAQKRVTMSRLRRRVAERLKDSQNTYAMLTTFQECDMHNLTEIRNKYKDDFQKKHGVKLGFMSAFVKAAASALTESPIVNAVIEGEEIVYRDNIDISVAVATPSGLVVPVLRGADKMSFADVEKTINDLGTKARDSKLTIEDMTGGTFTISNGGVYGSLMGTPIINPPQSAILGMHAINKKPVVVGDNIVIRPMMYLALTYDHRLIDGRDAVLFLRKIKSGVEDPVTLLLSI